MSKKRTKRPSPENRRRARERSEANLQGGVPFRWPKGVSGNPGGRPKGFGALTVAIRELLDSPLPGRDDLSCGQAIAYKLMQLALRGNVEAIRVLGDRGEGRPFQMVEFVSTQDRLEMLLEEFRLARLNPPKPPSPGGEPPVN